MTGNWAATGTYLVTGVCLAAVHAVLPPGAGSDAAYLLVGVLGLAAIMAGVRLNRPVHRTPWYLMAGGQACWLVGDALYDPEVTTPALSDAAYLIAYPLLVAGIALLVRHRRATLDAGTLIDAAIVTLGAALVVWVYVADPIVHDTSRSALTRAVAIAYPAGDILLLGLLVALVTSGARSPAARLLIAAVVLLVCADTLYAPTSPASGYDPAVDLLWLGSYLLWGLSALHPSMRRLTEAPHHARRALTPRRLAALAAAALVAPLLVVVQVTRETHVDTWLVVAGASLLSLLVIVRLAHNAGELRETSLQRDELHARLFHEASHDSLTGVANGPAMHQRIGAALRRGQRTGTPVTVLLVDLDRMTDLNHRHGHAIGDQVLRATAERIRDAAPDPEAVGRLAGDVFVVCADSNCPDERPEILAARLLRAIGEPVVVGDATITVGACLGAALSLDGGTDAQELVQQAQVAVRRAKATGSGTFEIFGDGLRRELADQRELESALVEALDAGQLEVHYQPVVAVQSEVVDGYEARVHWNRPGHGWQDSTEFLAVAARSDLICRIDLSTIATAATHLAEWTRHDPAEFADLTVAVPISGRTLGTIGIAESVSGLVEEIGVAPHRLTIGVTEMALVDVPHALIQMASLRDRGIFVAVNEFGTGHTSIAQLRNLPADVLKIDSSLVNSDEPGARDLMALLVNAAHGCGLLAVADGVSDATRLAELRELRYDSAQGIYSSTTDPAESGLTVLRGAGSGPHLWVVPDLPED